MTACVKIKFGTLILVLSLMSRLLGKVNPAQTQTYEKQWMFNRTQGNKYCTTERLSLSCTGQYIFILYAYREKESNRRNLSDQVMTHIIELCNCKTACEEFKTQKCIQRNGKPVSYWTFHIKYQCTHDGCSQITGSTTSNSSGTTNATTFRTSTTTQLPPNTTKTTVSEKTSLQQYTMLGNQNRTTSLPEATISSVARSLSYDTTVHNTNEPQFDLYLDSDENTDKVIIAVCVFVVGFGLAGCILAVILYRRWENPQKLTQFSPRSHPKHLMGKETAKKTPSKTSPATARWQKKTIDYVYHNSTTSENTDTGFTNLTYSETANKNDVKHDDTQSHSADSGYTDMRVDETLDETNDDYYSIKDGKEETLQPENDNYYAIKDNVEQEYNKITFRPKSIPEDPCYVHTLRAAYITDKTYDHVDGKECIKSVFQDDNYSHLNQRKDHSCNVIRCSPISKPVKEDGAAVEPNEEGIVYTPDHKYFTLETNNYSRQKDVDKENDMPHGYFVLEKENPTKKNLADGNGIGKKYVKISKAVAVQESDPSVSSSDHAYFENCHQADAESDIHQYQALQPQTSDPAEKANDVNNVSHDYFVLDKEIHTTERDKKTDVSHDYFVLEDEISAKNNSKDDNDISKIHATVHATSGVQNSSTTSSSELTYFENCMQADSESDTHQYQTLEQHILKPNVECQKKGL